MPSTSRRTRSWQPFRQPGAGYCGVPKAPRRAEARESTRNPQRTAPSMRGLAGRAPWGRCCTGPNTIASLPRGTLPLPPTVARGARPTAGAPTGVVSFREATYPGRWARTETCLARLPVVCAYPGRCRVRGRYGPGRTLRTSASPPSTTSTTVVDPGVLPECRSMHFRNALNSADPVVLLGSIPERETRDGPVDVSPTHGGQMVRYGGAVPQGTAGAAVVGGGCSQMCNRDTPGRARRRGTGGPVGLGWCASGERA